MTRRPRIEIVPTDLVWEDDYVSEPVPSDRPHFLRVRAANGEIVLTSEMYATRSNARRAARALKHTFGSVLFQFISSSTPDPIREVSS